MRWKKALNLNSTRQTYLSFLFPRFPKHFGYWISRLWAIINLPAKLISDFAVILSQSIIHFGNDSNLPFSKQKVSRWKIEFSLSVCYHISSTYWIVKRNVGSIFSLVNWNDVQYRNIAIALCQSLVWTDKKNCWHFRRSRRIFEAIKYQFSM